MEFKLGDILYRKYSDKHDLCCVVAITEGPFNIGPNVKLVRTLSYYAASGSRPTIVSETSDSIEEWYVKVDLNNYDIKDKFLNKIKEFLNNNLGKMIHYDLILDNLLYIEILAELRQYETEENKKDDQ